jgi:hypothetical protein
MLGTSLQAVAALIHYGGVQLSLGCITCSRDLKGNNKELALINLKNYGE